MFTPECQQLCIDHGGHALGACAGQGKAGPHAARKIKLMKDDAAAVEKQAEKIKKRYSQFFRV